MIMSSSRPRSSSRVSALLISRRRRRRTPSAGGAPERGWIFTRRAISLRSSSSAPPAERPRALIRGRSTRPASELVSEVLRRSAFLLSLSRSARSTRPRSEPVSRMRSDSSGMDAVSALGSASPVGPSREPSPSARGALRETTARVISSLVSELGSRRRCSPSRRGRGAVGREALSPRAAGSRGAPGGGGTRSGVMPSEVSCSDR